MTTSQLEKDGIPTFYIATNGTVCTHRMSESDIPVWCQSGKDGDQVMNSINMMKQYMPKPCKGEWESPATTCPDAPCNDCTHSLQEQVKQLTAQNERLRDAGEGMLNADEMDEEDAATMHANLNDVLLESPIVSLAYIEIAAIKKYGQEAATDFFYWFNKRSMHLDPQEGYAEWERRHGGVLFAEIELKAKKAQEATSEPN